MTRQPIFDGHQKVVAYELLYRNENEAAPQLADTEHSGEMILNVYTSISDAGAVRRVPAFLPVSPQLLLSGSIPDLPRKQVVIELEPDESPDREYEQAVLKLMRDGYRICLRSRRYNPRHDNLLKMAQIVKLDVRELDDAELKQQLATMAPFKVAFLAAGIEQFDQLERCVEMGFKLYQGGFLSRPKMVQGRRVSANQVALMQLIQELQKPSTTPEKLESLILRDPVLTFKLLRIVNSAAYALVRKVDSIAQAVVLLGLEQVRKWATLIAMSANRDKPEELARLLLIRGRMCELVAEGMRYPNASSFFMAGMMSGLHAMLDIDRDAMLEQVPLGDDIKMAICDGAGTVGTVLGNVVHYESGDWDLLPADFDGSLYDKAYRASLKWTQEAMQAMYED
ncbi:EAL and HDOD domain-containing protein [Marinobacterium aestuariivivens]|uniref:EAL and HDOD domain-containing protein n=1 Tax=Marinobacterium aestuariivivens TaxID=1698799 RepID=A0ABW2A6M7_9GAMM